MRAGKDYFKPLGMTLLELLTVLLIIGLLASFTIPSFYRYWHERVDELYLKKLSEAILYAEGYAMAHHASVVICPGEAQQNCQGSWQEGLTIQEETAASSGSFIKPLRELDPPLSYQALSLVAFSNPTKLTFFRPIGGLLWVTPGHFELKDIETQQRYDLIISSSGRLRREIFQNS